MGDEGVDEPLAGDGEKVEDWMLRETLEWR